MLSIPQGRTEGEAVVRQQELVGVKPTPAGGSLTAVRNDPGQDGPRTPCCATSPPARAPLVTADDRCLSWPRVAAPDSKPNLSATAPLDGASLPLKLVTAQAATPPQEGGPLRTLAQAECDRSGASTGAAGTAGTNLETLHACWPAFDPDPLVMRSRGIERLPDSARLAEFKAILRLLVDTPWVKDRCRPLLALVGSVGAVPLAHQYELLSRDIPDLASCINTLRGPETGHLVVLLAKALADVHARLYHALPVGQRACTMAAMFRAARDCAARLDTTAGQGTMAAPQPYYMPPGTLQPAQLHAGRKSSCVQRARPGPCEKSKEAVLAAGSEMGLADRLPASRAAHSVWLDRLLGRPPAGLRIERKAAAYQDGGGRDAMPMPAEPMPSVETPAAAMPAETDPTDSAPKLD